MSCIIIDGYNLIGIQHRNLRAQRELLIASLIAYRTRKGHDITVVFDGWRSGEGKEHQNVTGGVRVVYSRIGEKADAVLKRMISSVRREWIVVTSDRDIADHAWAAGSIPVSAKDFLYALQRSGEELQDECDSDEIPDEMPRKGNPRKLSKRAKAVRRALQKL